MNYAYQIDYLPVGDASKAGDAICMRYATDNNFENQKVIVIDGGYSENGENIVSHLRNYYNTNKVDLVIATHSDHDHCLGLKTVITKCEIKQIWMHKPWEHSEDIRKYLHDGRITDSSLSERLKESFKVVYDIVELAIEKNIPIQEPFEGLEYDKGVLRILGPSKDYYQELLIQSPKTPQVSQEQIIKGFQGIKETIIESLDLLTETLSDPADDATSHINSTSTIIWFNWSDGKVLFTSDAGVLSIQKAIDYSKSKNFDILSPNLLHCPHHGSKRNVGPSLLNQFQLEGKSVIISCPKDGRPKHPSQRVVNALIRRGANVVQTAGKIILHQYNASREGWSTVAPMKFEPDLTNEDES